MADYQLLMIEKLGDDCIIISKNIDQQCIEVISKALEDIDSQQELPKHIDQSRFSYVLQIVNYCPECGEQNKHEIWQHDKSKEYFKKCSCCDRVSKWG